MLINFLGIVFSLQERNEDSMLDYTKYIKLNPYEASGYFHRGSYILSHLLGNLLIKLGKL